MTFYSFATICEMKYFNLKLRKKEQKCFYKLFQGRKGWILTQKTYFENWRIPISKCFPKNLSMLPKEIYSLNKFLICLWIFQSINTARGNIHEILVHNLDANIFIAEEKLYSFHNVSEKKSWNVPSKILTRNFFKKFDFFNLSKANLKTNFNSH